MAPVGLRKPLKRPQARGLVEGLTAAQQGTMDAAYDADHLRTYIANELGATAHIKRNPTRREGRYIDWALHKERHLVECVRPALSNRWRSGPNSTNSNASAALPCIALHCEKSLTSLKAIVDIACAMAWIS